MFVCEMGIAEYENRYFISYSCRFNLVVLSLITALKTIAKTLEEIKLHIQCVV